jgi:DNA-binding LytR/AlgR family response regulator
MITCGAIEEESMALGYCILLCPKRLRRAESQLKCVLKGSGLPETGKSNLVFFVDINMPEMSGMLAQSLTPAPLIIFTSAYGNYEVDSYNVNALDHLLRPIALAVLICGRGFSKGVLH